MNEFLRNAQRIEFVITLACTGKCKHCSEGDHTGCTGHIDTDAAVKAVRAICANYKITSLMTFGGEPLLYPDTVCAIHKTATELGINRRQLITNGYFSKDPGKIGHIVTRLAESGVNELLLSVDSFHQETIPLQPVKHFAKCLKETPIQVEFSPAWLVSREDDNPYNIRTREILRELDFLGYPTGEGNVIFPSGNALKYLREYLGDDPKVFSPYEEDPRDIRSFSFGPDGSVDMLGGNICEDDIIKLAEDYRP
ncbi:MAG: radical SAM protein [Clostridiales bacterium]|nr:radical SAM protein [Clostridiales bacterium]